MPIKVPQDISYVGFDPVDGMEIFGLDMTCLDRDVLGMGATAIRLLLQRIDNPQSPIHKIVIPPTIEIRGSEVRFG